MSWCRGILSACALAAAAAQAQQMTELVRTGVWRTIDVPPVAVMAGVAPVPEIHIAPGTATMLVLPVDIAGRGGFALTGGEGRVSAHLVDQTTIVLVTSREVGPERIPLGVETAGGRRYAFMLVTRPGVVDMLVRVVFAERTKEAKEEEDRRGDAIVDGMLKRKQVFARQYEPPAVVLGKGERRTQWRTPYVACAVRMGNRYYIQVDQTSPGPWKVDQAKLEGGGGEMLRVQAIHWGTEALSDGDLRLLNTNVIVAEVPAGAGADYVLKSVELVSDAGHEARVAILDQKVSLP